MVVNVVVIKYDGGGDGVVLTVAGMEVYGTFLEIYLKSQGRKEGEHLPSNRHKIYLYLRVATLR